MSRVRRTPDDDVCAEAELAACDPVLRRLEDGDRDVARGPFAAHPASPDEIRLQDVSPGWRPVSTSAA